MIASDLTDGLVPESLVGKSFVVTSRRDAPEIESALAVVGFEWTDDHIVVVYRADSVYQAFAIHVPSSTIECSLATHTRLN